MAEKTKTKEGRSGGNKGSYEGKGEQALRQTAFMHNGQMVGCRQEQFRNSQARSNPI